MGYVVLQASFRAVENDVMISLNLFTNQGETWRENGVEVWHPPADRPQPFKRLKVF